MSRAIDTNMDTKPAPWTPEWTPESRLGGLGACRTADALIHPSPTAPGCPMVPGLASGHPSVRSVSRTAASPAHAQIFQVQANAFRVCDALRLCASDVPSIPPSRVWPTKIPSETRNTLNRVSASYGPAPGPTRTTSVLLRVQLGLSQARWGVLQ